MHRQITGKLVIATHNPGKLAEMRELLAPHGVEAISAGDLGVISERDLAPTILHLAGLPTSRELDGQVLEAALTSDFRRGHSVRAVASYGGRVAPRAAESTFDRAMLEELRSLGYIQ